MDSTNSGSSSGDDEDYDFNSRSESISSLFYSTTTAGSGAQSLSNLPPPPQLHHHHLSPFPDTSFFDSNLVPFLDLPWSRNVRPTSSPNPNPRDLPTLILPSSSSSSCTPTTSTVTQQPLQQPAPPPPDLSPAAARRTSKKRSRASRRAPTTVLTTDTSNFRAMVQEFTGIPAPPFASSSSSFPRSRFDLFRSAATDPAAPPYLLRPFVQKAMAQPLPFLSSSPAATAPNPNPNPNISTTTASHVSTSNYQLSNQALLNIQNPNLTFHSLLQSSISLPTMPVLVSAKPQAPLIPSDSNYGGDGDMGIPTNMASSGWAAADGSDQVPSSCKMNFAVPASAELDADKESGSIPGRSEAMMDSWICSSD